MEESSPEVEPVAVLVVGAGPTGLTLACDLLRRGLHVRVIDRASAPNLGSRGKALQPRTLEVFEDLGVLGQVLAHGAEYPRVRMHVAGFRLPWRLLVRERVSDAVPYPNVWLLPQSATETILRERLEQLGGRVEWGTELVALHCEPRAVTATLRRGGALSAQRTRFLVAADGAHSQVRKTLGIDFVGARLADTKALVGDLCIDGLDPGYWHIWPWAGAGPISACPLPGGERFQLFAQLPADGSLELSRRAAQALLERVQPTLRVRDASWLSLYRPSARLAERYRAGPVFLAGDAAHVHPPTGAQGLNLGVQDAYNLGWKLAAVLSGAGEELLDSYEEERRPVAAEVLGLSTRMLARPWQRRGGATKQLSTSYRAASLATELRWAPGRLRAGDRAPDASLHDAQGGVRRLFELMRGPRAAVLSFGASSWQAVAQSCEGRQVTVIRVVGSDAPARRAYGVAGDAAAIIRADGYVGLIARAPRADELSAYLDRIGALRARWCS